MVVVSTRRVGGKPMQFEASCIAIADPEIDTEICSGMKSLTHWYNGQLANAVADAPEQYWWMHRRWRKPPEKVARRLAKAAA
jgi:KDO2-lipid IV(A) lauroyltransferase